MGRQERILGQNVKLGLKYMVKCEVYFVFNMECKLKKSANVIMVIKTQLRYTQQSIGNFKSILS